MFSKKRQSLFEVPVKENKGTNGFVNTALKKAVETKSGNGALKYASTGDDFVDQFGKLGTYRAQRSFEEISKDIQLLWSQNPLFCVMFLFFMRIISRVTSLWDGSKTKDVQKGSGLKHESIMRMIWLHLNAPETFWKNIKLYISIGSWKDIFEMLRYDLEYNDWEGRKLNWDQFGKLILAGLENPNTSELVKKYLPQIQARSKCTTLHTQASTILAKWICGLLFGADKKHYKQYRQLKASGKAHTWQQLISQKLMDKIDFDTIHGRALLLLVSSKFITNNGLETRYNEWIDSKPIAKFTGYVHELAMKITSTLKPYQKKTLNKQFDGLVELAQKNVNCQSGLITVLDTSGSMSSNIIGQNFGSAIVAKAMGIFFSAMLKGAFKNAWIEFNSTAKMHVWKGETFIDKWLNHVSHVAGDTNFLSVANVFAAVKKQGVPESDYPTGILCISDWEFNPGQCGKTNVESFKDILRRAGFSNEYIDNFKIILWNIPNTFYSRKAEPKFETFGDLKNVFYLSGYDPSILGFLLGSSKVDEKTPETPKELFEASMKQEILQMIEI